MAGSRRWGQQAEPRWLFMWKVPAARGSRLFAELADGPQIPKASRILIFPIYA